MAMEPASNPHGAVARDNGMIAAAPRRKALRGMSESVITLYKQEKTPDCASSRARWLEQSCALVPIFVIDKKPADF
jgi:hypothetical protein